MVILAKMSLISEMSHLTEESSSTQICVPKSLKILVTMNVAAILLLLVAASATRTNGAGIVELASAGSKFEDLPYAAWLSAGNNQINVSIEVGYVILYRGGGE